ncbi:MAG: flagellar export chaperone FlgN [Phycisphaeraceae bacterium]
MTEPTVRPSRADVGRLIERLSQQRDLYQQLKALSDQQGQLIADGQGEQLLAVLAQRQGLVDQLAQLNEQLAPFKEHWPTLSDQLDAAQRQQVNGLLEEVETLLESIIQQDDRHREQLQAAKQQIGRQLEQTHTAGRALNAYKPAGAGNAPARFTDRQG